MKDENKLIMVKVKHFTEPGSLERLFFVIQNGRQKKAVQCLTGLETFVVGAIAFNRIKLTPKGVVSVFKIENNKPTIALGRLQKQEGSFAIDRLAYDEEVRWEDLYIEPAPDLKAAGLIPE